MVKWNLLVGWGLIGGKNPTHNVGPRGGPADVGELLEAKSLDDIVEVRGCIDRKAPEEYSPGFSEQGLEILFLVFDGFGQSRESEGKCRTWR